MSDNFSQGGVCELLNRDYRAERQPATDRLAVWTISVGVCFVCVSSAIHIFTCFIHSLLFFSVLAYEKVYLDNIPSAESYEQSYMHRDVISHVLVTK